MAQVKDILNLGVVFRHMPRFILKTLFILFYYRVIHSEVKNKKVFYATNNEISLIAKNL